MNDEPNSSDLKIPGLWYLPVRVVALGDGSYRLFPGKPVRRGTCKEVSKATGVHRKVLHALAEAGLIRRAKPSPSTSFFYFAEVEDLIQKTEADPDFWTSVRKSAYLKGLNLRSSKVTV